MFLRGAALVVVLIATLLFRKTGHLADGMGH
jgi:hypothetical protein